MNKNTPDAGKHTVGAAVGDVVGEKVGLTVAPVGAGVGNSVCVAISAMIAAAITVPSPALVLSSVLGTDFGRTMAQQPMLGDQIQAGS